MSLSKEQIQIIKDELVNPASSIRTELDLILNDETIVSPNVGEPDDWHKSRLLAKEFNKKLISKSNRVEISAIEKHLRKKGLWVTFKSSVVASAIEFFDLFLYSMKNSSIDMRKPYMSGLLDQLQVDTLINLAQKNSFLELGDYNLSAARSLGLPKLHMRDLREARK